MAFGFICHSTAPDWNCLWHVCTIYLLLMIDLVLGLRIGLVCAGFFLARVSLF